LADTYAMQLHLDEISRHVAVGAHAVLLMDRAGWRTTANLDLPDNITPIFLPSRAPELNPVENVWQYLRANWLSNRVFDSYDAIIDAGCEAWNKLLAQPERINVDRQARLGARRSILMTIGITSRPPQSGRIEARTGLRMMPTSPRSPLSFRMAGFPQYGWKAGPSDDAFPQC
jgi:transposase